MPLDKIKNAIYQNFEELFALAAVDELTGDMDAYRTSLNTIAQVAELLGMETETTTITFDLKADSAEDSSVS